MGTSSNGQRVSNRGNRHPVTAAAAVITNKRFVLLGVEVGDGVSVILLCCLYSFCPDWGMLRRSRYVQIFL